MIKILKKFFLFCGKENKKKYNKAIILGVFIAIFEALRLPAAAIMIYALISNYVKTDGNMDRFLFQGIKTDNMGTVCFICFVIMLIGVIGKFILQTKCTMLQTEASFNTVAEKRMNIAEHMRYIPMGFFNNNSLGGIASVTTNTMDELSDIALSVVMFTINGLLATAVLAVLLPFFDLKIGIVSWIGIVLYLTVNSRLQKTAEVMAKQKTAEDSVLVDKVLEYVQGITEVKNYHLAGKESRALNEAIESNKKTNIKIEGTYIPYIMLQNIISKLTGVVMSGLSIYRYLSGEMGLANCILMIVCAFMIYDTLEKTGQSTGRLRQMDACIDKAMEILDLQSMDIDGEDIETENHDIEMKNVWFSYGNKSVVNGISAIIPENKTTAIVGPSGSGKTTVCHLIARFWDVNEGEITLGGRNVKDYSMDSLMKNFSFVFQDVYLFHDTVANNIRFGRPEASMDEVIEAAKKAKCHDFIMKLPEGYDTVIGEGGGSLSGGEQQRLSIARAIMKDSPVIVLDEATANIDPENEKDLMDAIEELTKEKTIIMIAHKLKTVRNADQILVIEGGRIAQKGTHDELMKQEGIYRRFIESRKLAASWKI